MVSSGSMQASTTNPRKQRCICVSAFVIGALCFVAGVHAQGTPQAAGLKGQPPIALPWQIQSDHPIWKIDLHTVGFPGGDSELQSRRALEEFNTVDFLGEGVVAATFITRQSVPGAQRRDDPDRVRPYLLHAIFLDAPSGKVLNTLEWAVDEPNAGIFPVSGGGFLFFSGDKIALYGTDRSPIKEVPLPQLQAPHTGHIGIAESPSDKSMVIRYQTNEAVNCIHVSTGTLDISDAPCAVSRLFS